MSEVSGYLESHETSHHGLAVDPPELHGPLQLHRAVPLTVQEVEQTSMDPVLSVAARLLDELANGHAS